MKIYSWNVNGLRAVLRRGDLQEFISRHDPDILCLQETKAARGQVAVDLSEYEEHWSSAKRKGYSGTAIFTKHKPQKVIHGLSERIIKDSSLSDKYGDATEEGRVTTLEFETCFIVSVYTPNAKNDLSRLHLRQVWDTAFLAFVRELEARKPVIFAGDLNVAHTEIDLARPKENRGKKGFTDEERDGFQAFVDNGFVDTFRIFTKEGGHYTWWSHFAQARERNIGWRIDYIMTTSNLAPEVQSAQIHPKVTGSDHCPVSLTINLNL